MMKLTIGCVITELRGHFPATQAPAISTAIVSFIIALPLDPAVRNEPRGREEER